jgi:cellulose synthase (UDP-forming)
VPFRNFLDRLVGFFHRSDIALVQTPQTFRHPGDRLGRLTRPPQDTGVGQSHRDVFGSVLGRGSCYVVRRQALMLAGGYTTAGASAAAGATASAAAGATSLNLWDQGGKVLYLDERLSLGESPQTLGDWLDRCWRQLQQDVQLDVWRRRRLSRMQKIVFASQLIQRLPTFCRLGWLLVPILSLQWGALPYVATVPAVVSYFLPFWVALVAIAGWTTGDRRSYFWAEVDAVVFCLPALVRLGRSWGLPLGAAPTRSASAIMAQRNYHWPHNLPLAALLLWTLAVALHHLWNPVRGLWMWPNRQLIPLYVWLGYNAVLLVAAIGRSIDQPLRRMCDRLPLQVPCRFLVAGEKWPASTVDLSEQGARLHILPQGFPVAVLPEVLTIELGYPALRLQARVVAAQTGSRQTYIQVAFQNLRLAQQRQLIELIYGSPLDWQQRPIVGGLPIWRGIVGAWGEPLRPILRHYR